LTSIRQYDIHTSDMDHLNDVMTLGEAARMLGRSEAWTRRHAEAGEFRTRRTQAGHRLFSAPEVRAYIARRARLAGLDRRAAEAQPNTAA